ncbi:transporter [Lichenibacterium dinghuense]|uniref:transporter n=1 Tax=Lichenibacterium dinghuense TaxID=2895977 RepID=UPI001F34E466|nr:transporter [Lichenibacterium sp. 6Y81]
MFCLSLSAVVCCSASWGGQALAEDASPDKSGYFLFNPTPDGALRSFATDRPLNAFTPYTVDAGRYQVESDILLFGQSSDRTTTTHSLQALDPEVRVGLTRFLEFDVVTAGLQADRTTSDRTGRTLSRDTGTGAVTLRARYNVVGDDAGPYAFTLIPFVAVPSGDRHFGNQRVEGGVVAPLGLSLPYEFTLILQTQVQAVHNASGAAYASFTDVAYLQHAIPGVKDLSGVVEFTATNNGDRHTADTYTFDTALAYLVDENTQLDLSAFVGLNRAAPDFQIASGIVHRF